MTPDQKNRLARERAEAYAPAPTGGAVMAGLCVAVVALVLDFVVSGFYDWRVSDHLIVALAVTIAGFWIGFLAYRNLARLNRRAVRKERGDLED